MRIGGIMGHNVVSVCFAGKIIDAHTHVGQHEGVNFTKVHLDSFFRHIEPTEELEKMIVSDLDVLQNLKGEFKGNEDILKEFASSSRYALVASCSPNTGNVQEIKNLFSKYPNSFVGLKFHPEIQKLELSSPKYNPYFEFATQQQLPCLIHSAVNTNNLGEVTSNINRFSDPEIIYQTAKKYPKTPIVMAHLGAGWKGAHDKTIDIIIESIKNKDANLYADISWVDIDAPKKNGYSNKDHILKAIKRLKGIGEKDWKYGDQSYRLMFGTDSPLARFNPENNPTAIKAYNYFVQEIEYAIKTDADLSKDADKIIEDLFYNNAKKLYLDKKIPKNKSNKPLIAIATAAICIAVIAGVAGKFLKNINKQ